jgi:tetratricopeptide (TPR) repeat protein
MRDMFRLLLILLAFAGLARAASFEEANAAFSAGDYQKAAAAYEAVIAEDGPSAARLYNLGNARFRLGEYGPAILAYERAAVLAPRDADIRANLKTAREAAESPSSLPDLKWWETPLHWLSLAEWSWLAAAGAVMVALLIIAAALSAKHRARALIASGFVLLLTALSGAALYIRRGEKARAIVTAAEPKLLLSPFAAAGSAGTLKPGTMVLVEKTERGWHYVRTLSGGVKGWLPEAEAGMLMMP